MFGKLGIGSSRVHIILIAVIGFIVYFNSLSGEFICDDHVLVEYNTHIRNWKNLPLIFSGDFGFEYFVPIDFYRPLQSLTYMIDYSIWGLRPFGYHLSNIFLHILAAALLYCLVTLLFGERALSFLASILFVVHPVHSQAVCYISGRGDLLSAAGLFFCMIFYIRYLRQAKPVFFILALVGAILALLAKENALVIPLLLLAYHICFRKKISGRLFFFISLAVLIYLFSRSAKLSSFYPGTAFIIKRIPGFFVAIREYLRILFFPFGLHMDYGNRFFYFHNPLVISGILATTFLSSLFFLEAKRNGVVSFSILWFLVALLPTTSVYPVLIFYMAEQWLYLPSLGFFVVLAYILLKLYGGTKTKLIGASIFILSVIFFVFLTIRQNNYWRKEIPFYQRTLAYNPQSSWAYLNLGVAYQNRGNITEAMGCYKKAVAIDPNCPLSLYKLGCALYSSGNNEEAISLYKKASIIKPDYRDALKMLCYACVDSSRSKEAVTFCARAAALCGKNAQLYYYLGNSFYDIGDKQMAIRAMLKAIEVDPGYLSAYNDLAAFYLESGQIELAIQAWNRAIEKNNLFTTAHFNLAVAYFQKKEYDLAIKHADTVIAQGLQIDPKFLKLLKPYRK